MQTRVAFNSGELSPEMACRADIEQYGRGCSTLENWEVSQMGGVKRRRGMRHFATAYGASSRLVPYVYSYTEGDGYRFLCDVGADRMRVFGADGAVLFEAVSGQGVTLNFDLPTLHWKQINKLLILTCATQQPMVLQLDDGVWTLKPWSFKHRPWKDTGERDWSLTLSKVGSVDGVPVYSPRFADGTPDAETVFPGLALDYLRATAFIEQQESGWSGARIREGVTIVSSVPETARKGDKFAVLEEPVYKAFSCINQFASNDNYVAGLDSPANYQGFFSAVADDDSSFADAEVISTVQGRTFAKGAKVRLRLQFWRYWTCVRDFGKADDGSSDFASYPDFFADGLQASDAILGKSSWSFYCSGLWYGEYKVKRNYDSFDPLSEKWETRGISRSNLTAPSNISCSGTEADEECALMLFLTRSRALSTEDLAKGFVPDSCENRLIVSAYARDYEFSVRYFSWGAQAVPVSTLHIGWEGERMFSNWSWGAFSERYGFPLFAEVFQSRLVFAATQAQPQTLWMSRTDDLDNFMAGSTDDAAIALTLRTTSQNPICWLLAQSNRIMLGTGEGEFAIGGGQAVAVTAKNATANDHSHVGSASIDALAVVDKVLYVERGAGRVYEFGYNLETDGYLSRDLSVFAPHILPGHGGAVHSALLRKPDTVALFTLADGQLALCTYNAHQEVKAWHRWVTDGSILDVAALPDGRNADRLFLLVERGDSVDVEVVDNQSDFEDNGHNDYVSVLVTNPLNNPLESFVKKRNDAVFHLCFGEPFTKEDDNITISKNDGHSFNVDYQDHHVFERGWHDFKAHDGWEYETIACIRVHGNNGCNILALQA